MEDLNLLSVPSLQGHVVKLWFRLRLLGSLWPFSSLFAGTCGETGIAKSYGRLEESFSSLFAGTCGETGCEPTFAESINDLSVPSLQGHVVKPETRSLNASLRTAFSSLFAGTCGETQPR